MTLVHWSRHQPSVINTCLRWLCAQLSDLVRTVGHEISRFQHCLEWPMLVTQFHSTQCCNLYFKGTLMAQDLPYLIYRTFTERVRLSRVTHRSVVHNSAGPVKYPSAAKTARLHSSSLMPNETSSVNTHVEIWQYKCLPINTKTA